MFRIIAVCVVVVVAVFAFLLTGLRDVEKKREIERELLENGGRGLAGRNPDAPPSGSLDTDRPRGADDVLIELRWPEGSVEARISSPVLMSVRGNLVCWARTKPAHLQWRRRVLKKARYDRQLAAVRELPDGQDLVLRHWNPKGPPTERRVQLEPALALLTPLLEDSRAWWPEKVSLQLEADEAVEDALPWPTIIKAYKEAAPERRATHWMLGENSRTRKFMKEVVLNDTIGPDPKGNYWRLVAVEMPLP